MSDPPQRAAPDTHVTDDPPITEVMSTDIVAITPDASLGTALRLMAATGVRHLPVVDGHRCLGLVSEADLVGCLARESSPLAAAAHRPVWQLTRRVTPVPRSAHRSDAAWRMHADGVDAVLVTDNGRLVGIVTATDLIRSLAGHRSP